MIIFVGAAGSGKSIQARLLAQELKCDYLSMGQFLRDNVTPEVKQKMLTGTLISDQDVVQIISNALAMTPYDKEFILDGFPRTLFQADWLITQVHDGKFRIKTVINLKSSAEVTVPRLLERRRPDDNMAAITQRLNEFNSSIMAILGDFQKAGIRITTINAEETIERVHANIMAAIKTV